MIGQLDAFEILKWMALVFLAGFIGFYGKYLGRVVLGLFDKKTSPPAGDINSPGVNIVPPPGDKAPPAGATDPPKSAAEQDAKLRKKALKARAKLQKKQLKDGNAD